MYKQKKGYLFCNEVDVPSLFFCMRQNFRYNQKWIVEKHTDIARSNIERANLNDRVEVRTGLALDSLQQIENEKYEPFDFIFIDADKQNNPAYFEWALKLSHPGTVIVGDNVVREGKVIDNTSNNPRVQGIRRFYELIATEPRVSATALQTVGSKGYDGFIMAVVKE